MDDFVPNGTGNSRYLKSVSNFLSLYPTYGDFVAALIAGTLPVDFNGVNSAGYSQLGMLLNKANLLPNETCDLLGIATTSKPKDALNKLATYVPFYEKIRDIADTSATTTLSLDISDIDWSVWQEIRLIMAVGKSTAGLSKIRMNNLSAGNYIYSTYPVGSATGAAATTATEMIDSNLVYLSPLSVSPTALDLSIYRYLFSASDQRFCYRFNRCGGVTFSTGMYGANIATLSTINLISNTAGHTISIADAALWGVRR